MEPVPPCATPVALIAPHMLGGKRGRPTFPVDLLLRTHVVPQGFTLRGPPREEPPPNLLLFRDVTVLSGWDDRLPEETTILCFHHLLEKHDLAYSILDAANEMPRVKSLILRTGIAVDATLIAAPSSTENNSAQHGPEMEQSKLSTQWFFGMKVQIGVDAASGFAHTVRGTARSFNDSVVAN